MRVTVASNKRWVLSVISALMILVVNSVSMLATTPAQAQDQYLTQYQDQYQIPIPDQTSDQYATGSLPAGSIVYFPYGNGITYSCSGGPPFIVDPMSGEGNCTLEEIGALPAGVGCYISTPIEFVHDMHQEVLDGWLCQ